VRQNDSGLAGKKPGYKLPVISSMSHVFCFSPTKKELKMKKFNIYTGLTGVGLCGFFCGINGKVVKMGVTTVQLKANGRVSPQHLIWWAKKNGFVTENIPNVGIRIGKAH